MEQNIDEQTVVSLEQITNMEQNIDVQTVASLEQITNNESWAWDNDFTWQLGCGSGSAWIRSHFPSSIRIRIQERKFVN